MRRKRSNRQRRTHYDRHIEDLSPLIASWPVAGAAVGVSSAGTTIAVAGDQQWVTRLASVTKLFTAYAGLVALEEGTIALETPVGPPGATVRHLLAHAAGYGFNEGDPVAEPGMRRVYSNVGIEVFAEHLAENAGMSFERYLTEAVLEPLSLSSTRLVGSPAHGLESNVDDLLRFSRELLRPTLIDEATLAMATSAHYPGLDGVLPGFGRHQPNPWGLGFEVRGAKDPHWTAPENSPATFGHFGGAGTFLWVDPAAELACCCVTNREFGPWAAQVWPEFSSEVLAWFAG